MAMSVLAFLLLFAACGAAFAAPAFASDKFKPIASLSIEPIFAGSLLAPAEPQATRLTLRLKLIDVERVGLLEAPLYRLEREGDTASGKRAKLSIAGGDTRVFAFGGKLSRRERPGPPDPIEAGQSNAFGRRKMESGRLYGGGVERRLGPVELSAAYQYSRINAAQLDPTSDSASVRFDDKSKSHSLQVGARIRF